jgi:hypothetical protein
VPLTKTPVPVNFAMGLDQKTDPKQIKVGRFLGLKNRVFNKQGLMQKRNGYDPYGQSVVTPVGSFTFDQIPASVSAGRVVEDYKDELILNDGLNFYSLSDDEWIYKGRMELCQTSQQSILKNKFNNIGQDSALNATLGINVFAWESWTASPYQIGTSPSFSGTLNGTQAAAVDYTTGQVIFSGFLASTTSRPKCVSVSNKLYVIYFNSATGFLHAQPVTKAGFGSASQIITNIDTTTPNYDVTVMGTTVYIAYNGSGSTVKVASFDADMAAVASASKSEVGSNGVGVFTDTSNRVWVCYNNSTETKAFIMDSALSTTALAPTVVDNGSGASGVKNVTGVWDGSQGVIFYDKPGAPKVGRPVAENDTNYYVSASFTQPAVGATVSPSISGPSTYSGFFANNSIVYVPTGGYYFVTSAIVGGVPQFANLGFSGNAAPSATVASTFQTIYTTAGFQNSIVTYNTLTVGGTAGSASVLMRSAFLGSKAYLVNSVPHVTIGHDSTLQSTYFACALYNISSLSSAPRGLSVAKICQSSAGGLPYRSMLPAVNTVSTGVVQLAVLEAATEILRTSNDFSSVIYFMGVSSAQIDYTTNNIKSLVMGENLNVGSGILQMYDGANVVEQGFNIYPETVTAVGAGGDGGLSAGTYGYKVIYEWIDNQGQTHRSAPSGNISYVISAAPAAFTGDTTNGSAVITNVSSIAGLKVGMPCSGTGVNGYIASIDSATQITMSANSSATGAGVTITPFAVSTVALTIPTLRITEKQNVTLAIYRTEANGTVYYRIDTQYLSFPIASSSSSDTVTFSDVIEDENITGNEQLYTATEVENIAPPAVLSMFEYKNRIMLIPSDKRLGYWYSKQIVNGSPPEFSDEFQQNVPESGGNLVGGETLDDKAIFYQASQIRYVTGTGPGPSGANNDFSDPQFITADATLLDPRSLVSTPVGQMFKSAKGIYLLDRSLQTRYIGKGVENYNQYTARGAVMTPTGNQVRFILSNGECLVYNYYWTDEEQIGQWAVFDNIAAVSDCLYNGLHTYVTSGGLVYRESPGTYVDGATGVQQYFKSGWFNLAGLIGYERAYFFYLLGECISSTTLTVNIYYDYDDSTPAQTIVITPSVGLLEERIFFTTGKIKSFLIEIQESGSSGAGFTLSGLNVVAAFKKGYTTIRAANSGS